MGQVGVALWVWAGWSSLPKAVQLQLKLWVLHDLKEALLAAEASREREGSDWGAAVSSPPSPSSAGRSGRCPCSQGA